MAFPPDAPFTWDRPLKHDVSAIYTWPSSWTTWVYIPHNQNWHLSWVLQRPPHIIKAICSKTNISHTHSCVAFKICRPLSRFLLMHLEQISFCCLDVLEFNMPVKTLLLGKYAKSHCSSGTVYNYSIFIIVLSILLKEYVTTQNRTWTVWIFIVIFG